MQPKTSDKFRELFSQGNWTQVAEILPRLDPEVAADFFLEAPVTDQEKLFGILPVPVAARLIETLPYFDSYVLLTKRSPADRAAILGAMKPGEALRLFDELPDRLAGALTVPSLSKLPAFQLPEVSDPVIEARQIEKSFTTPEGGRVQVIASTNLSIEPGKITALLGPSGSGKSTLLRMLAGLAPPTSGEVFWHGQPMAKAVPNIAIVFQSFALFPWLTVAENVEAPLLARGLPEAQRRAKVLHTLESVGLKGFANAYPKELSGGMRQRVGFARALAVEPEILFMDEPFSALDVLTAENLRGELMELWLGKKIPTRSIFLVTHNIEEAVSLADRVIVLGRNPGRIRADFNIAIDHPRSRSGAEFVLYVDYIYKLLTKPELPAGPMFQVGHGETHAMLPHARRGAIAGLLELLNSRGGKDDLYQVAEELQMQADDLLPIIEAASLLGFVKSARGDLEITPEGKAFAEADITARKLLFRHAGLAHVTLLQKMHGALTRDADHSMDLEFFRDGLREYFSESEVERQIETALNWGRYADLFTYDADSGRLFLDEPGKEAS